MRVVDGERMKPILMRSRKLRVAVTAVTAFATVMGLSAIPAASAADCTVTVQITLTGGTETLQLPVGAPLPAGTTLVSSVCPPPVTTPAPPPSVPVPTTSTPSTTTTSGGNHTSTGSSTS